MENRRTARLNSLLKEVISEVLHKDVKNPMMSEFVTVTRVEITNDLHYAKVYITVVGGDDEVKQSVLAACQSAAGFIAVHASKKVVMRYFPELTFRIDRSLDQQLRIEELVQKVREEREERENVPEVETTSYDTDSRADTNNDEQD
ncbi:MAG: ribosome-binding factor A [Waddliaceae bacterium]|nr:ribosome-binding factor A [Waddliaceae bacterium]